MKGLDYVAIDPGIAKDPKIALMASRLKKDRFWVAGHFPAFFGEVAIHAEDGKIGELPNELLDSWAGEVRGWGALVKELLCVDGVLSAWWKYNGRALTKLERDRDRKAKERAELLAKVHGQSEDKPQQVVAHSGAYTGTGTDTTSPNGEDPLPRQGPISLAERRIRDLLEPFDALEALDDALSRQRKPGAFVGHLWAILNPEDGTQGPGGRPMPAEVVALALKDAQTSLQGNWSAAWFRAALARVMHERTRSPALVGADSPGTITDEMIDRWARG